MGSLRSIGKQKIWGELVSKNPKENLGHQQQLSHADKTSELTKQLKYQQHQIDTLVGQMKTLGKAFQEKQSPPLLLK